MKYIVMECHLSYAVLLDEEGRFHKAANRQYQVGQAVTDVWLIREPEAQSRGGRKWLTGVMTAAACLLIVAATMLNAGRVTYASVYVTINPEVRIDVNKHDEVVSLAGLNADGIQLIEGYDHRKKTLDLVMDELVDQAMEMGFLSDGSQIKLELDGKDQEWVTSHQGELENHLNDYLTQKIQVTIVVEQGKPGDSDYGASDYGASDYGETERSDGDSGYGAEDGKTDYDSADGDTPYDPKEDGQTDYGKTNYGQSDYEVTEVSDTPYDESDDGDTPYDKPGESDTPYDESGDGVSDYPGAKSGDDGSDYEH